MNDWDMAKNWIEHFLAVKDGYILADKQECSFIFQDMCRNQPDRALSIIREIARATTDERLLGILGAGPIEELLVNHWSKYFTTLCYEADMNPYLRSALLSVWLTGEDNPEYLKLYTYLGIEPPKE